jgi:RHS repeat-associated protein
MQADTPTTTHSYYRARYYDPQIGRFISEDPIGFRGGMDFYAYVGNSPYNFSDSLGLRPQKECPRKKCDGEVISDDAANLRLFPTLVGKGNHTVTYRLRTADGKHTPNGRYTVFEHQTQGGGGRHKIGENDNVSPYPSDPRNYNNVFEDDLSGGLNTVQTFTISPISHRNYDPNCQFQVFIHYGGKDYGSQVIRGASANAPVIINYYSQLPESPEKIDGEW